MPSEAQKRATAKYRKEKEVQRVVRFSPAESELLGYLDSKPNRMGYIKSLIRADMEERKMGKKYEFESANKGTIEFVITGEYVDGGKDIEARIGATDESREWAEADGGTVDEMFEWLIDKGVEFESARGLYFNTQYVASVMLDGDATQQDILRSAGEKTDEDLAKWREFWYPED
ncbi:hypothetical protein [Gordonibacter sp.]|uniref:hypothetical protein n=1 Tax=Gordonibacter sp. TaxID=1968902 RepID=UPI002FC7F965